MGFKLKIWDVKLQVVDFFYDVKNADKKSFLQDATIMTKTLIERNRNRGKN